MIVYKFNCKCYSCKYSMTAYTYLQYRCFYDDVTFPYEDWMMNEVYANLHPEHPYFDKSSPTLNFPVKMLGSDRNLDKIICNAKRFPNIRLVKSKQEPIPYYANVCPKCGAFLGKYHLGCVVTDNYLKSNLPMDIECILH